MSLPLSIDRLQSVHLLEDELWGLRQKFEHHVGLQQEPVRSVEQLRAILHAAAIVVPKSVLILIFDQCVKFPSSVAPALPPPPQLASRGSFLVNTGIARSGSLSLGEHSLHASGATSPHHPLLSSRTPRASLLGSQDKIGGLGRSPQEESFPGIRQEQSMQLSPSASGVMPGSARRMTGGLGAVLAVRRAMNVLKGSKGKHTQGNTKGGVDGADRSAEDACLTIEGFVRCCTIIKRLFLCCHDEGRDAVEALVDQLKRLKPPPLPAVSSSNEALPSLLFSCTRSAHVDQ